MRIASSPKTGKYREAFPGCMGIGKRDRWGGSAWPDRTMPRGGSPRNKRKKMPMDPSFVENMDL
jgi:hypothetical protein